MRYFYFLLFLSTLSFGVTAQVALRPLVIESLEQEKIFIHTDRDYYTAGGTIYFKVYLSDLNGKLSERAFENVHLDLIDAKGSVAQNILVRVANGTAFGAIDIQTRLTDGPYKLRAFTERTKDDSAYHFLKTIIINGIRQDEATETIINDTVYIALLPEGGSVLDQTTGKIGIHATDFLGNPVRMNGELPGHNLTFETNEAGLCAIDVQWALENKYSVKGGLKNPLKYIFPEIEQQGVMLRAANMEDHFEIIVNSSVEMTEAELIVSQGDIVLENSTISGSEWKHTLYKEKLPTGLLRLTTITHDGLPLCERLIFNDVGINNYNLDLEPEELEFGSEEAIELVLDLYDDNGESLSGNFSGSIVDRNVVRPIDDNANIDAYHYLTSNLMGNVFSPNEYFNVEEGIDSDKIELLLLTYGWRKFKKPKAKTRVEDGFTLSGTITKKDNPDKGVQAKGLVSVLNEEFSLIPFITDSEGRFELRNLSFFGNRDFFIQGEIDNKKSNKNRDIDKVQLSGNRNVDIILDTPDIRTVASLELRDLEKYKALPVSTRLREAEALSISEKDIDIQMNIDLEGVTLTEQRIDRAVEEFKPTMLYSSPGSRIRVSEIPQAVGYEDIYDVLIGRVPGIKLDGPDPDTGAKHKVILRDYSAGGLLTSDGAQFYVNGTSASQVFAESIRPVDIEFIDVVKSLHSLAGYGGNGVNGIVFIYLKSPEFREYGESKTNNGILNAVISGYNKPREFYKAKSNPENTSRSQVTIHWEPNIVIDESGTASFTFGASSVSTTYDVLIQGLTEEGLPVVRKAQIQIK